MAITKVTKKDNFKAIVEVLAEAGRDDLVAVMEHEIELLNKKHGESKADTERKAKNAMLANEVVAILEGSDGMTATDIAKALSVKVGEDFSNQKASALIKMLGDKVTATMDGKRKLFSLA